jgi:hypothetical protein
MGNIWFLILDVSSLTIEKTTTTISPTYITTFSSFVESLASQPPLQPLTFPTCTIPFLALPIMSLSQSIKNLLRHGPSFFFLLLAEPSKSKFLTYHPGKQARTVQPHDNPTAAHEETSQPRNYDYAPPAPNQYANSDPTVMAHQACQQPLGDAYSGNDTDARNRGAQAANVAAHAAGQHQKAGTKGNKVDQEDLAKPVAEDKESKGKLPKYPGLERWQLLEKMGDGAFSNVYRARDLQGNDGEVAIKVVRKFELNSGQVSEISSKQSHLSFFLSCTISWDFCQRVCGDIGWRSPTSGLQEAAESCGGQY